MRAIAEDRKLKDMVAELLEKGLSQPASDVPISANREPVFPLVRARHPASPEKEMTPARVADILLNEDADRALGR